MQGLLVERKGTGVQNQVPGPTGPPSSSGKSHPSTQSNTHPLAEKWQCRASLKILGAPVGRSQGKRIAGSPPVLGGGGRWGRGQMGGEGRWQRDGGMRREQYGREEGEKVAQREREERIVSQQREAEQEGKPEPRP